MRTTKHSTYLFGLRGTALAFAALAIAALGGEACGGKVVFETSAGTGGSGAGAPNTVAVKACEKMCVACPGILGGSNCDTQCETLATTAVPADCAAAYADLYDCRATDCGGNACDSETTAADNCLTTYCASHPNSPVCPSSGTG